MFMFDLVASVLVLFFGAMVFQDMWAWFILPFFDLPYLPFGYAVGILLMIAMFTFKTPTYEEIEEHISPMNILTKHLYNILTLLYLWILAWVVYIVLL